MNGTYEITDEMRLDNPIWRKVGCEITRLEKYSQDLWVIYDKDSRIPYYTDRFEEDSDQPNDNA